MHQGIFRFLLTEVVYDLSESKTKLRRDKMLIKHVCVLLSLTATLQQQEVLVGVLFVCLFVGWIDGCIRLNCLGLEAVSYEKTIQVKKRMERHSGK